MSRERFKLLTAKDASPLFGASARTMITAAKAGQIPAKRIGRRFYFNIQALAAWMRGEPEMPEAKQLVTYFLEAGGLIKIGKTNNLPHRLKVFKLASPVSLRLLGWILGDKEFELHHKFSGQRQHPSGLSLRRN